MSECIAILVFDWEVLAAIRGAVLLISAHLGQVRVVIVVANLALLRCITVVH